MDSFIHLSHVVFGTRKEVQELYKVSLSLVEEVNELKEKIVDLKEKLDSCNKEMEKLRK